MHPEESGVSDHMIVILWRPLVLPVKAGDTRGHTVETIGLAR